MVLARERFGHDAVRAQLDLADFLENLAGNHGEIVKRRLRIAEFAPLKNLAGANKSTKQIAAMAKAKNFPVRPAK